MLKYTIAIPTHNNDFSDIQRCLISAMNVDFIDYEIIVSDSSDTKDNYVTLKEYIDINELSNIRIYKNDPKWSMWDNHNFLLKKANGKYVFFLHSDDVILPNALNDIDIILKKYDYPSRIIIVGCSIFKNFKTVVNELELQTNTFICGFELVKLFTRSGLTPSGTLFSIDMRELGGFIGNAMILPCSDCWTELNCALHGFRLLFSENIFFIRDSNGTKLQYGSDKEMKEVYFRIKSYFPESLAMVAIDAALEINSWHVLKYFTFEPKYKKYIMKKAWIRFLLHPYKNRRIRRLLFCMENK